MEAMKAIGMSGSLSLAKLQSQLVSRFIILDPGKMGMLISILVSLTQLSFELN